MKRLFCATPLRLLAAACVFSVLLEPAVGNASAITYEFAGVVTAVAGFTGVTVGMPVTGTYTINLGNANPSQQIGTIGSTTASWEAANYGGPKIGTPAPTCPSTSSQPLCRQELSSTRRTRIPVATLTSRP